MIISIKNLNLKEVNMKTQISNNTYETVQFLQIQNKNTC
jgi:hypothetical protein